jgi:hypothetical protein
MGLLLVAVGLLLAAARVSASVVCAALICVCATLICVVLVLVVVLGSDVQRIRRLGMTRSLSTSLQAAAWQCFGGGDNPRDFHMLGFSANMSPEFFFYGNV